MVVPARATEDKLVSPNNDIKITANFIFIWIMIYVPTERGTLDTASDPSNNKIFPNKNYLQVIGLVGFKNRFKTGSAPD
jgi:hypothetical protein